MNLFLPPSCDRPRASENTGERHVGNTEPAPRRLPDMDHGSPGSTQVGCTTNEYGV